MEWSCYISLHQQRAILYKLLTAPAAINQFPQTMTDKQLPSCLCIPQGQARDKVGEAAKAAGQCWEGSCWQRGTSDIDLTEVVVFLPCPVWQDGGLLLHQGEGQARMAGSQEDNNCWLTHVNLEDKGPLAKMIEVIRINYKDDLWSHWGGNTLGPKPIASIVKLEKTRPKNWPLNWG